ncbi:trypsin-like peptidase domain-containing protein [Clostridium sp. HMP27]|uniref:S1C family serine protease n=1 Tax=Clostridium sp. HMP27 TaxID=1487921 RepID=UPI00052C680B|nr:trypsin-like peptidase domain-containing protein [Clostridium sp. HMP27]KGK89245.1 protease [Clostridium sp. HMP27]
MDDYKYDKVTDVSFEEVDSRNGNIKFKKKNRYSSEIFKLIAIIVISALSGAVGGAYIVEKYQATQSNKGNAIIQQTQVSTKEVPKNAITNVAETVGPAVVGINNKGETFWGDIEQGSGSGIIFEPNGYIVTNYHVISGASKVTVKLSTGKVFPAKLVAADQRSDLAIIKIEATNLPAAKFGDSSKVRVGDLAIAIGNPLGEEFAGSVTSGIISALNREMQYDGAIYKVLQTDAAINPGNSGGALCNENGEVIGINSLKIGSEANAEGMGFAIASNEAKAIIDSLMNYGKVKRPALGVIGQAVNYKNGEVKGFYVSEVIKGSGASNAGIKPTDIITEVEKTKINSYEDLAGALDNHKIGDTVSIKIWRSGNTITKNLILSEM